MWYKSGALSASRMLNAIYIRGLRGVCGGGAGIRTLEGFYPLLVFKTSAFNRSATPPIDA